jgi:putative tricarboxylic transport membrane protein
MSEGSGGAAQAAPGLSEHQFNQYAGITFIVIAMIGPAAAALFGKGSGIGDMVRLGWYSLPMAVFGLVALFVHIKNGQDYYGGAILAALALFALWACSDLPGMRGFAFGPGTAPRLFAYGLLGLAVMISVVGLITDGPPSPDFSFSGPLAGTVIIVALIPITYFAPKIGKMIPNLPQDVVVAGVGGIVALALPFLLMRIAPRGPLFITAATVIFAITVRPLGLVIASFISLCVSAYATEEFRWGETIICAAVLTAFCSLLFPYGLNLPLQLWPRF